MDNEPWVRDDGEIDVDRMNREVLKTVPLYGHDKPPKRMGYKAGWRYCPECGGEIVRSVSKGYHDQVSFGCEDCDWSDGYLD